MSERKPLRTVEEIKLETFDVDDVLEDDEWAAELERRIAEIDSGEVTPIPIEEARAQWRELLR